MPRPERNPDRVRRSESALARKAVRYQGHQSAPSGFTLVELLMVIAIIGILVSMGVVGINAGAKAIQKRAIALEVAAISQAVEAYKMKYGDYPPDGSSRTAFEAHFRKAFPNIAGSEFLLVAKCANSHVEPVLPWSASANQNNRTTLMDPAEALVFCLGGFSNNPQYPFTGAGGPIYLDLPGPGGTRVQVQSNRMNETGIRVQYNVDRNEGQFPMNQDRLSIDVDATLGTTVSIDDSGFSTAPNGENDFMPTYIPRGRQLPIVYFNSTTYRVGLYDLTTAGKGAARPYRSDQVNTNAGPANPDKYYRFMNDKSFQIISAGLDDHFGGVASQKQLFFFPSGSRLNVDAPSDTGSNYQEPNGSGPSPQLDNVTNFSEGPLEDSLP